MLVLTSDTLLFVVFTAIVWYEFFFSMSALEWIITLRVLTLLGGLGVLLFLAVSWDAEEDEEAEDAEEAEDEKGHKDAKEHTKSHLHRMTMCTDCSKAYHRLVVTAAATASAKTTKEEPDSPQRPLEESDEFADLLNPGSKQVSLPK